MAKKVNKRAVKAGNIPVNIKKSKVFATNKFKNVSPVNDFQNEKLPLRKRLSKIDGIRPFSVAALAVLFGFFNSYHQATLFENDRHFSHLSTLEREMTFKTEMGLYYFYYKILTESPTLWSGITRIMNDNLTEYPSVINTLERFTLYPEVILAASFRNIQSVANFFNVSVKECWQVSRGDDLNPIESCEGVGDPAYFYVTSVFLLNGFVSSLLFLYGAILSDSFTGGILAAVSFFFNHGECTRVQWTPPLRESFGYPMFLLQMMLVTLLLKCRRPVFSHSVIIAVPTLLFMLSWQFAQFALLTQLLTLFGLYILGYVQRDTYQCILKGHAINLSLAVLFLFGNKMLIASYYASTLLVCYIVATQEDKFRKLKSPILAMLSKGFSMVICCLLVKLFLTRILQVQDDAHIWNLLKSKFTDYKDFHTMLYTCAIEFDFLPKETFIELTKTLVFPSAILVISAVLYVILFNKNNLRMHECADVLYNLVQFGAFFVMALLVMRLKLFFTPHLCLVVSLTMSPKFFRFLDEKDVRTYVFVGLLGLMSVQGVANIREQRNILGEFSHPDLEELISWINTTLPEDSVFAGPMPTMANVLLSTRRPIVNHPHYENADLRERTLQVYQIFSRKTVSEVHNTLLNLEVDYVVLERNWCFGKRRDGCAMVDLWDAEDPQNRGQDSVCHKIIKNPYPFRKVFRNGQFTVLAI